MVRRRKLSEDLIRWEFALDRDFHRLNKLEALERDVSVSYLYESYLKDGYRRLILEKRKMKKKAEEGFKDAEEWPKAKKPLIDLEIPRTNEQWGEISGKKKNQTEWMSDELATGIDALLKSDPEFRKEI